MSRYSLKESKATQNKKRKQIAKEEKYSSDKIDITLNGFAQALSGIEKLLIHIKNNTEVWIEEENLNDILPDVPMEIIDSLVNDGRIQRHQKEVYLKSEIEQLASVLMNGGYYNRKSKSTTSLTPNDKQL